MIWHTQWYWEFLLLMAGCRLLRIYTLPIVFILLRMCAIQGSNTRPLFPSVLGIPERKIMEMSPSSMEFFGPSAGMEVKNRFPHNSPAEEPAAEPSKTGAEPSEHLSGGLSESAVAGLVFSVLLLVVFAAVGSYIYVTRKAKFTRIDSIRSQVWSRLFSSFWGLSGFQTGGVGTGRIANSVLFWEAAGHMGLMPYPGYINCSLFGLVRTLS